MAAFDQASELLIRQLEGAVRDEGDAAARFERAITTYLEALASEPGYARLFLVEVFAAGPEAIRRRSEIQHDLAQALVDLIGVTGQAGEFACQVIVSAVSSMVTPAVAAGDMEALQAVGPPIVEHVRLLLRSGALDA
jgi:hypothetical protein